MPRDTASAPRSPPHVGQRLEIEELQILEPDLLEVPLCLCPRSTMLYLPFMTNSSDLTYDEGQSPLLYLEADLRKSVTWADGRRHRWAFTNRNAGAGWCPE